jgi:hypothetical protein
MNAGLADSDDKAAFPAAIGGVEGDAGRDFGQNDDPVVVTRHRRRMYDSARRDKGAEKTDESASRR